MTNQFRTESKRSAADKLKQWLRQHQYDVSTLVDAKTLLRKMASTTRIALQAHAKWDETADRLACSTAAAGDDDDPDYPISRGSSGFSPHPQPKPVRAPT